MSDTLWDATDVAQFLKCSRSYVYKTAEAGILPCLRVGSMLRFEPDKVRTFALGTKAQGKVVGLNNTNA